MSDTMSLIFSEFVLRPTTVLLKLASLVLTVAILPVTCCSSPIESAAKDETEPGYPRYPDDLA